jgi:hypothetical protein
MPFLNINRTPLWFPAAALLVGPSIASAQLSVVVPPAKAAGQKAVLLLVLSSGLPAKAESA